VLGVDPTFAPTAYKNLRKCEERVRRGGDKEIEREREIEREGEREGEGHTRHKLLKGNKSLDVL
jgi:hypothetical protein